MNSPLARIKLRPAESADAAAISRLIVPLSEIVLRHAEAVARQALLQSMSAEGITSQMSKGCDYHLALAGEQLVGVAGIKDHHHLYHLFVDEAFQHRGIARRLWSVVLDDCMKSGSGKDISVNAAEQAKGFYEHMGFIASGGPQERNGIRTVPMVFSLTGTNHEDRAT